MDSTMLGRRAMLLSGVAALIASRSQAASNENADSSTLDAGLVAIPLSAQAPKGAIPLFAGRAEEMRENWYQRYTTKPANWAVSAGGVATPEGYDITSRREFGDCYIHVEFRCPADAGGHPISGGNSGVGLQGRYEIQILNSYGQKPEEHGCGALYSEKSPRVNASKKPGEWQTFDIAFRAPRFNDSGKVVEQPRATVFQNGVLVQNNEEFTGMTGIQYGQYKEMTKTGPIVLQGDHDPVQFRNVWIVPL